ncbi:MAG: hypothetical protein JSR18_02660 [Proteobacteria bacterium]|nr:hypothetical protein [Pseudomonadota bacterium]
MHRPLPIPAAIRRPLPVFAVALAAGLLLAACASPPTAPDAGAPARGTVVKSMALDPALEDRILALDPAHVSAADIRDVLAHAPAPRLYLIHGGIFPVFKELIAFGEFTIAMGYPESAVHDPGGNPEYTHSPYDNSADQAGAIAWYYEHEGLRPMIIGHSQGGMQGVKVLYELAGLFGDDVQVFDPTRGVREPRNWIVDPLTGEHLPVTKLRLPYATSVAAGGLTGIVMPNQWSMERRTFEIPDSVEDFTGFLLDFDFVAWESKLSRGRYRALGDAHVVNVKLPYEYNHYYVVNTSGLADDPTTRAWLDAWTPALREQPLPPGVRDHNTQWGADVWYSVKYHWVTELQRAIRARRTRHP